MRKKCQNVCHPSWAPSFIQICICNIDLFSTYIGSVALLSHFDKVLALSKFAILKCENEVNPIARIPWAISTAQFQFARYWWPRESVLLGSLHFCTLKVRILKVLTLCQSAKVKQRYLCYDKFFNFRARVFYVYLFSILIFTKLRIL